MTAGAWWVGALAATGVMVWPDRSRPGDRLVRSPPAAPVPLVGGGAGLGGAARGGAARGGAARRGAIRPARRRWVGGAHPGPDAALLPLLEGLASTLRAGLTPERALAHLRGLDGADDDGLAGLTDRLALASARGARLAPVWRAAGERSGSPAMLAVAEGWRLSEQHGAPIVDVLDALSSALRDQARTDAAVETALAAPRATARLLGVLPLGGVALGELVGVHPTAVLLGTAPGRVVGLAGLTLTVAGRVWMRRLVDAAMRA